MDGPSPPARQVQNNARAQALGADFSKLSVVELGARRGIGPLSPVGEMVWHGEARPCVSCGQLVRRTASRCDYCGQLLSGEMIQQMRKHSGPWYVLEHVRPFPGVSKERLVLQIRRGVLTATTILRGPSTHHQWRFAAETPGLSKYLGSCWACQATVHEDDTACPVCRQNLDSDGEEVLIEGDETLKPPAGELEQLKAAVQSAASRPRAADVPAQIGKVPARWIVAALVVLLVAVVYFVARARTNGRTHPPSEASDSAPLVLPQAPGAKPAAPPDPDGRAPAPGD
ncbi:MAG: hypothetical protein V2A79_15375 [Planctomycetota bacterium]